MQAEQIMCKAKTRIKDFPHQMRAEQIMCKARTLTEGFPHQMYAEHSGATL